LRHKDYERLISGVVARLYKQYPNVEWDDLESQAWLIITEDIDKYDGKRGASLSTYLYGRILGRLQHYIQRVVLKEYNMNGMRDHAVYLEASHESHEAAVDARLDMERMLEGEEGTTRDLIGCMMQGYTQSEAAVEVGISRQRASKLLLKVRVKYE